jgi:hypothetical protein
MQITKPNQKLLRAIRPPTGKLIAIRINPLYNLLLFNGAFEDGRLKTIRNIRPSTVNNSKNKIPKKTYFRIN